jgi:hypothetical protein
VEDDIAIPDLSDQAVAHVLIATFIGLGGG